MCVVSAAADEDIMRRGSLDLPTNRTDLHIIDQWANRELFNTENKTATQTVECSNSVR